PGMSVNMIARRCRVSESLARHTIAEYKADALREKRSGSEQSGASIPLGEKRSADPAPEIRVCSDGRKMNVANIGKSKPTTEAEPAATDDDAATIYAAAAEMDAIVQVLRDAQKRIHALATQPGAELLRSNHLRCEGEHFRSPDVANAIKELQHWKPHSACPYCVTAIKPGCHLCKSLGWITESALSRCPQTARDAAK